MKRTILMGGTTFILAASSWTTLDAQQTFPLAPVPSTGQTVSPFFEGWFENADGTYTLSFGYFNRNASESVYIPVGPKNFVEPGEFDGFQPEHFPPRRVRGVFTVTVPAEYGDGQQRVIWTLINQGQTLSVPGRVGVPAYELGYAPMAMGSLPPIVRFEPEGTGGRGPMGVLHDVPLTASVGQPSTLSVWAVDESLRSEGQIYPVEVGWVTHQGPAAAVFSDEEGPDPEAGGKATVLATFPETGAYVLRVQADVFSAPDSSSGNQCCWTNGYLRVNITP